MTQRKITEFECDHCKKKAGLGERSIRTAWPRSWVTLVYSGSIISRPNLDFCSSECCCDHLKEEQDEKDKVVNIPTEFLCQKCEKEFGTGREDYGIMCDDCWDKFFREMGW